MLLSCLQRVRALNSEAMTNLRVESCCVYLVYVSVLPSWLAVMHYLFKGCFAVTYYSQVATTLYIQFDIMHYGV